MTILCTVARICTLGGFPKAATIKHQKIYLYGSFWIILASFHGLWVAGVLSVVVERAMFFMSRGFTLTWNVLLPIPPFSHKLGPELPVWAHVFNFCLYYLSTSSPENYYLVIPSGFPAGRSLSALLNKQ